MAQIPKDAEYEEKVMRLSDIDMHLIGDFEQLKQLLVAGIPLTLHPIERKKRIKEILHLFNVALSRAHFLIRLNVKGAHRFYYKMKVLRHFVRWSIKHNKSLDRPKLVIDLLENRVKSVQEQVKTVLAQHKKMEFALP